MKVELSGGIRDDAALRAALATGATRVVIGTAALEDPDWVAGVIAEHGDRRSRSAWTCAGPGWRRAAGPPTAASSTTRLTGWRRLAAPVTS